MWRARGTNRSRSRVPSPNERDASEAHRSKASSHCSTSLICRIPLPPPPLTAFRIAPAPDEMLPNATRAALPVSTTVPKF